MRKLLVVFIVFGMTLAFLTMTGGLIAVADDDNDEKRKGFTLKDLRGSFGFSFQGAIFDPVSELFVPVAATGHLEIDGKGNIFPASRTINIGGLAIQQTFSCTITVLNPEGTGSAVCPIDDPLPGAPEVETFDFVIMDDVDEYRFVGTTPESGIVVLGTGRRQ